MRHKVKSRKLGRTPAHRKSMMRNLAISLIEHGRIETTLARAKELRSFVEPLVTLGKHAKVAEAAGDNALALAKRRLVISKLANADVTHKLFEDISPLYADTAGGYTRIMRTGVRKGDNSPTAIIEFTKDTEINT